MYIIGFCAVTVLCKKISFHIRAWDLLQLHETLTVLPAIFIFGLPHLSIETDGLLLLKLHKVIPTRKSE
jgi:hypothetical protein